MYYMAKRCNYYCVVSHNGNDVFETTVEDYDSHWNSVDSTLKTLWDGKRKFIPKFKNLERFDFEYQFIKDD